MLVDESPHFAFKPAPYSATHKAKALRNLSLTVCPSVSPSESVRPFLSSGLFPELGDKCFLYYRVRLGW